MGKFLINLINKKFHKQFSSSWAYLLLIPLPLSFVLFFAEGCSFKYIDPQYYEFKRLCENVDNEVTIYNEDYWEMYKNYDTLPRENKTEKGVPYFYNKKLNKIIYVSGGYFYPKLSHSRVITSSLEEVEWELWYEDIHYANKTGYNYKNYGAWLKGDEGAGWHWKTEDNFTCSYLDNFYKTLGR